MKALKLILTLMILIISTTLFAQRTTDVENAKDYPLVSRFKGSIIEWYEANNFGRYYLLYPRDNTLEKIPIEGNITRIQYSSQPEHSIVEISKSYIEALKSGGFKILLILNKTNCGLNLTESLYVAEFNGLNALPAGESVKPDFNEGEFSYLSATKKIEGKEVYVVVYVTARDYPLITFDAIEVQSMEEGLVTVKDMETGIAENGHIAIYGIQFETGKSEIMPESVDALKNIAEYINNHTDRKFLIVGHTDNVGDFDSNMALSKDRAEAVKLELLSKYSVNTNQMKTYGDGPTAPIANNSTEEGRAKNRRVEIVEQ